MMKTAAWKSLNCVERGVYIELAKRYGGTNNGRLACSLRQLAEELHIGKATVKRALDCLQERDFIICMKRGGFSMKVRHATEWRLTEYKCDVTGALPTKEFMRWGEKATGSKMEPNGFHHGTVWILA